MDEGHIFSSPTLFPMQIDGNKIAFINIDEKKYKELSFLDNRILSDNHPYDFIDIENIKREKHDGQRPCFIFHIGHCGSTLLSRLLGEHPELFSLREPGLLRDLASATVKPDEFLELLVALYGRVWRRVQTALIKATSFVSEIGGQLLDAAGGRAILLGVTPPMYLRSILSGPNSIQETRHLFEARRLRLEARLGCAIEARGDGERIALSWLCEMSSLQAIADKYPERSLRLDFDRGLADPTAWIEAALGHLGADPDAIDVAALVKGPLMTRYAKAPEHAYDAALRADLLDRAGWEKADEFHAGMAWLQRQAEFHPYAGRVLRGAADAARAPMLAGRGGSR